MSKIRILHVIKSLGRGGAEVLLAETLQCHDLERFEVHCIYFLPWKDQMADDIRRHGGRVTCIRAKNNIGIIFRAKAIVGYLKKHDIQVIHAHLPWAGIVARIVSGITGLPLVYTEHNKQERYHFLTRMVNLLTINRCTRVIAVSEDVQQSLVKHKPGIRPPVKIILNGVNTEKFAPSNDKMNVGARLDIPAGAVVVGTIAVFRTQKRLDLWLDVASEILKHEPNVYFVLVGDGPLKSELTERAAALGLSQRVKFAGIQQDVRPYLNLIDIYMMTSVFEGLPIALLEAMAAGCAVVSTRAGGIPEVIRHGQEGFLCEVNATPELVDHVLGLIQDPSSRKTIGLAARRRVQMSFDMRNMVLELEAVYRSLVD